MSAPIQVEDLGKTYRRSVEALRGVSFVVPEGSVTALLGPNGAGKSTTLHILLGFLRPTRGRLVLNGRDPADPESRRGVGFLPESFAFDGFSTGRGLLERFDALAGHPEAGREERVDAALEAVGLAGDAHRKVTSYSKGMMQRIGLGQALLGDPPLLVLDEPTSGMDPASRHAVKDLLRTRRREGRTTFLSSHILADVQELADRAVILREGRVVADQPMGDLLAGSGRSWIEYRGEPPVSLEEAGFHTEPSGDGRIRVTGLDEAGVQRALEILVSRGVPVLRIAPAKSDLEAVFLRLTEEVEG